MTENVMTKDDIMYGLSIAFLDISPITLYFIYLIIVKTAKSFILSSLFSKTAETVGNTVNIRSMADLQLPMIGVNGKSTLYISTGQYRG